MLYLNEPVAQLRPGRDFNITDDVESFDGKVPDEVKNFLIEKGYPLLLFNRFDLFSVTFPGVGKVISEKEKEDGFASDEPSGIVVFNSQAIDNLDNAKIFEMIARECWMLDAQLSGDLIDEPENNKVIYLGEEYHYPSEDFSWELYYNRPYRQEAITYAFELLMEYGFYSDYDECKKSLDYEKSIVQALISSARNTKTNLYH